MSWSSQKQKIQEERKNLLVKQGQQLLTRNFPINTEKSGTDAYSNNDYGNNGGGYNGLMANSRNSNRFGSNRPPSEQEMQEAQNSLRLLKAKMRNTRENEFRQNEDEYQSNNNTPYDDYNKRSGSSGVRKETPKNNFQTSPSIQNTYGSSGVGLDQGYSRNNTYEQQSGNSNYRKIFLPQTEKSIDPKNTLFGEKSKAVYDSYAGYQYNDNYNDAAYDEAPKKKNSQLSSKISQPPLKNPQPQRQARIPVLNSKPITNEDENESTADKYSSNNNNTRKPPIRGPQNPAINNQKGAGEYAQPLTTSKPRNSYSKAYNQYDDEEEDEQEKVYSSKQNMKNPVAPPKKTPVVAAKPISKPNKYQDDDEENEEEEEEQDLPIKKGSTAIDIDDSANPGDFVECPEGCGRSFNPKALKTHIKICRKVFQSKRKVFDSSQARALDEEEVAYSKPKSNKNKGGFSMNVGVNDKASKKSKWKQQSEAFRAIIKGAKGDKISKEDQDVIDQAQNIGLVQCKFCGRKFNDHAAKNHIPFCESKSKTQAMRSKIGLKKR